LLNILPEEVADELKKCGKATAKHYDDVTILFTDFVGFTKVSMLLTPQQLVDELHECFKGFDEIIAKYNIEKIKTVGDAYMAAAGLPTANAEHASDILRASLEIVEFMRERRKQLGEATFEVRVGVHSGSVVAGIVGVTKFAYDIWGDAVNTAARMEQSSEPGRVNVSQVTFELLNEHPQFMFDYRGEIEAKNKGKMKMYFAAVVK
jgi:class 3 adenylate cyclase